MLFKACVRLCAFKCVYVCMYVCVLGDGMRLGQEQGHTSSARCLQSSTTTNTRPVEFCNGMLKMHIADL